jgi:hypothetical protein
MINIRMDETIKGALGVFSNKLIDNATRSSLYKILRDTRNFAARRIGKETKIKHNAVVRGIKISKVHGSYISGLSGDLSAKEGDFIPISGSPYRKRFIVKQQKNAVKSMGFRKYQQVYVKFFGHDDFTFVPGAFVSRFRSNGGNHLAISYRRSKKKRLPLHEMFTNKPDVANWLIRNEKTLEEFAESIMGKEFGRAIERQQVKGKT